MQPKERYFSGFAEIKGFFFPWQMHVICRLMKTLALVLLSFEKADITKDHSSYRFLNLTHWWALRVPPTVRATFKLEFK